MVISGSSLLPHLKHYSLFQSYDCFFSSCSHISPFLFPTLTPKPQKNEAITCSRTFNEGLLVKGERLHHIANSLQLHF